MNWDSIVCKILSGRFILVIIVGLVYAYLACHGIIEPAMIKDVTMLVVIFYFSKKRNDEQKKDDTKA